MSSVKKLTGNQMLSLIISDREKDVNRDIFSAADWDTLAHKAHSEGVGPLLYRKLSRSGRFSSLSEETQNFLHLMYASTCIKNQILFKELESLACSLNQAGIEVVALKGVCFALTVYPEIGLRPMGDIDLLVPKAKLAEAVEIAKSLGYVKSLPEASPGLNEFLSHHVFLQKSGAQDVILELHDRLTGEEAFSYAVPVDWFWEQTEPLKPLNSSMTFESLLMLTPEAQVLYAASHAMLQHGGQNSPLRWFYDIDLLIRRYHERMDWGLLLSQAKVFEWSSALDAFLSQTIAYFDTPILDRVCASLSASSDRHKELVALKQTRPATHTLQERQKFLSLNLYGRIRLFLALLLPSPSYMRWRYQLKSLWLLPVYYPFRWWSILIDAVRTVLSLIQFGK
jgi:hypothetical protein